MKKTSAMVEGRIVVYYGLKATFDDVMKGELQDFSDTPHEKKFFASHKMLDVKTDIPKHNAITHGSDTLKRAIRKDNFSNDDSQFISKDNSCNLSSIKSDTLDITAAFLEANHQDYEESLAFSFGDILTSFVKKVFGFNR